MKATGYDEQQVSGWLSRLRVPAFAWAVLFALFAVGGSFLSPDATRTVDAVAALSPMGEGITDDPSPAVRARSSAEAVVPDAATVAHEALDPVGAGHSTAP